jgi:hypothetical protein
MQLKQLQGKKKKGKMKIKINEFICRKLREKEDIQIDDVLNLRIKETNKKKMNCCI